MLTLERKLRRRATKLPKMSTWIDAHGDHVREHGYATFVELGRRDGWRMHACGALRGDMLREIDDLAMSSRPCRDDRHLTERFYDLVRGEKDVAARRAEYTAGALLVALMISDRVGFA